MRLLTHRMHDKTSQVNQYLLETKITARFILEKMCVSGIVVSLKLNRLNGNPLNSVDQFNVSNYVFLLRK